MSDLLRCPNGCHDTPGPMTSGVPETFTWFDGSTGQNNYCSECGAELVPAEEVLRGDE